MDIPGIQEVTSGHVVGGHLVPHLRLTAEMSHMFL